MKGNFLDIIYLIVKRKRIVVIFTLVMSLTAVIYSLLSPEKWTSEFSVYPNTNQNVFSMAGNLLEGLGLGASITPRTICYKNSAILKSRNFTEKTIRKFHLLEYFEITEKDTLKAMDIAVKRFHNEVLSIQINPEVFFMKIKITTKEKYFSQKIAQHYLDELTQYSQNNTNNIGRQKRELLEARVSQITEDMMKLLEEVKEYQTEYNIIEIEQQAKASIEGYSTILKELLTINIDLAYAEKFLPNSIRHKDLLDRKLVISETLNKLEKSNDDMPFFLALGEITDQVFTIQEKVFKLEILKKVLESIYPQLELARIEELDNMDKFEIFDYPNLPGKKSAPKRALICIITFSISFFLSAFFVVYLEMMNNEDRLKIKSIIKQIFSNKSKNE